MNPPPTWRKSSRSSSGACVEVAQHAGGVRVRDSKNPDGPFLEVGTDGWQAFLAGVRAGDFDLR